MSSSQLTKSYSSEGRLNHQPDFDIVIYWVYIYNYIYMAILMVNSDMLMDVIYIYMYPLVDGILMVY